VGARGVLYAVYGLKGCVECCVHPYGGVGAEDIVIYRSRDSHHLDPKLLQPPRPAQAPFTTDHHETFYSCLLKPHGRKLLSFWCGKLCGAGGSQHRSAPLEDAPYPTVAQSAEAALKQPLVAGFYSHHLPAPGEGRACHSTHRSVHARCVAPAGQNRNLHVCFLLLSCATNRSPDYQKAALLKAEAQHCPGGPLGGVKGRTYCFYQSVIARAIENRRPHMQGCSVAL
jgi:hypothetical protein